MKSTELCPLGCGRALPSNKVMCAPCWREVPEHLKREVYAAWRALCNDMTGANIRRHRDAKAAAIGSVPVTLIFEPEPVHWCLDVLSTVTSEQRPPWDGISAGSVAQCSCGRFYVIDERTGLWRRIGKRSRVVRDALAHREERGR